jgi:hypothetical protein
MIGGQLTASVILSVIPQRRSRSWTRSAGHTGSGLQGGICEDAVDGWRTDS